MNNLETESLGVEAESTNRHAESGKLPWHTPHLVVHGDIAKITGMVKMYGGRDLSGVLDPFASDS